MSSQGSSFAFLMIDGSFLRTLDTDSVRIVVAFSGATIQPLSSSSISSGRIGQTRDSAYQRVFLDGMQRAFLSQSIILKEVGLGKAIFSLLT